MTEGIEIGKYYYFIFYYCLFYYSCPNFPSLPSSVLPHPLLPQFIPTLLSMSTGHSHMFFDYSLPLFSTAPPSSGSCQSVLCFQVSGSVLFISLFCSLDSSYKWYHMVFVFHSLAYSLIIMLSRSIHAVTKGRNSFFLSAL